MALLTIITKIAKRLRRFQRVQNCLRSVLLLLFFLGVQSSLRAEGTTREYKLKAVFLFNFVQYVEWPDSAFENAESPLIIGVLGVNEFDGALEETVANEIVNHRKLEVRYYNSMADVTNCQVLYISDSESGKLKTILLQLKDRPVLTVSDIEDFTSRGGMIYFVKESGKIRFHINLGVAKRKSLNISSKLLHLARKVINEKGS